MGRARKPTSRREHGWYRSDPRGRRVLLRQHPSRRTAHRRRRPGRHLSPRHDRTHLGAPQLRLHPWRIARAALPHDPGGDRRKRPQWRDGLRSDGGLLCVPASNASGGAPSELDILPPGEGTDARVTLASPAPPGGQVVRLFATNGLELPGQVVVPGGSRTARFHVQTQPGNNSYVATITAYIGTLGATAPLKVVTGD